MFSLPAEIKAEGTCRFVHLEGKEAAGMWTNVSAVQSSLFCKESVCVCVLNINAVL